MSSEQQSNAAPTVKQCITENCTFYGSADAGYRCSTCHRLHLSNLAEKEKEAVDTKTPSSTLDEQDGCIEVGGGPSCEPLVKERKVQKNKSRCWTCRKKIGLTGFECKCGYFFCGEHRYTDKHECDYDYQADAREKLKKANPLVVASKLDKI